jgi:AraC family transcriptional regulator
VPQGQLITDYFSTTSLWFIQGKSSCRIYYHGYDPIPRFIFHWDDQVVFEASGTDMKRYSGLIFRWVVDRPLPSSLKKEYYEINLGPYASTYEDLFKHKWPIPEIKTLPHKQMIGLKIQSTASNQDSTVELWKDFMPRVQEIKNKKGPELYSVQFFDPSLDFKNFSPTSTIFEKWAAVEVNGLDDIPEKLEPFSLIEGLYAVFPYKGASYEAIGTLQYIYETWIPSSDYSLDNQRGHLAIMGEKYKNNDPSSEEEFWIPIKKKI